MIFSRWLACLVFACAPALLAEDARLVAVAVAKSGPLVSEAELTGSVTASRRSRLSARTGGLIVDLRVDAGDRVKAGDLLMELDSELAGISLEMAVVEREQAELELVEARRLDAEARRLASTGAFARSEAESRETAVKVAEAALKGREVAEKERRALIERHRLLAPFDGVISGKSAEVGEWVQTGTPVVELVETGSLRLDVQAPQELFTRISSKPEIEVRLDSFPDVVLKGEISMVVPVNDEVARTFLARIELADPEGLATAGMSGRARFRFTEEEAVRVPRDAVMRFPDGTAKIWTVGDFGGKPVAVSRDVRVGSSLAAEIEVIEGLEGGEPVVVRGNESLREGQPLEVIAETPDSSTDR